MEKRGVSPVVGTILLIAITVALAAVVAALVGGLGARANPVVTSLVVEASAGSGVLVINHDGGDTIADAFTTYSSGLVACWHFDENSGTTTGDSSGNGNDGTINGADWTTGKCCSALRFDGSNDWVDCGDDASLVPTNITFEAWIKPFNPGGSWQSIIANSPSPSEYNYWFYLESNDLKLSAYSPTYPDLVVSNVVPTANVWYHVAFTAVKGGTMEIFVNGDQVGGETAGSSLWTGGHTTISDLRPGRNIRFNGIIDEVRIYNRVLSPEEIEAHREVGEIEWKNLEIRINGESLGTYAGDGAGVKDVKFNGSFPATGTKNFSIGNTLTMHFIDPTRPRSGDEITIIYKPANQKLYGKRVP